MTENYKLILVNLYSQDTMGRYLLSSYVLKAYLNKFFSERENLSVNVLNFSNKTDKLKICEKIIEDNPDSIGFSCYVWNIEKIIRIIKELKERSKSVKYILGGPEISLNRILSLPNPSIADYYVSGEGERKLSNLINYLILGKKGLDAEFPKGMAYWEDNRLNYFEDTDNIISLDEIPSVYITGVLDENLYKWQAFMETQRGCKNKCRYCVYHKNLPSISYYSLNRIFAELDYLIVEKQINALRIFDAVFTSDIQRAKEIVKHILELKNCNGVRLPWIFWELLPYDVDEEFIKLTASLKYRENICNSEEIQAKNRPQMYSDMLKDYTVVSSVGIQSFCKQALKAVARPKITTKKLDFFMNLVKKHNIVLKIDLILGLPFETFESYFNGLEFFLPYFKNTDHILNIHHLQILPGSKLEDLCETYRINYSLEAPHIVFETSNFSKKNLNYASKLTAVLFRLINSPLRRHFFDAKDRTGYSFFELVQRTFDEINSTKDFNKTKLVEKEWVDDVYWNNEIFRDVQSDWLIDFLKNRV